LVSSVPDLVKEVHKPLARQGRWYETMLVPRQYSQSLDMVVWDVAAQSIEHSLDLREPSGSLRQLGVISDKAHESGLLGAWKPVSHFGYPLSMSVLGQGRHDFGLMAPGGHCSDLRTIPATNWYP
jgi:hypothetical protein